MHITVQNLINIENKIKLKSQLYKTIKVIAVSKTFAMDQIQPLIDHGHIDFGENKVQEALDKWTKIKISHSKIQLHLIGKLQTNKVKFAVKLFDFIHSVDNEKLAKKISEEQIKQNKKIKIFIQVNIGDEQQKSGISKSDLQNFYLFCQNLNLDIVGLMCIPPAEKNSNIYFSEMNLLNKKFNLPELSMGMSSDYLEAINHQATYVRIGSDIFGKRN